jgi:N,N-dimethylformamidase beta subunit-like protein
MSTSQHHSHTRPLRRGSIVLALAGAALALGAHSIGTDLLNGFVGRNWDSPKPALLAAFPKESYRPGAVATLRFWSNAEDVRLQVFQSGPEHERTTASDIMNGIPVSGERQLARIRPGGTVAIRVGNWPSGLYFARLSGAHGHLGFAPFVLRPQRLGTHRVAVVIATQTWQAYNHRDDDKDGDSDTWYASGSTARLGRPHLQRGVPFRFKNYDLPFIHWIEWQHHPVDYLSDADLDSLTARQLAADYSLLIFPGHHEYVTEREYDAVLGFRNRGGNLIFMSANNFFWKIERHGLVMHRIEQWRVAGRPEAALIGTQYFHNDNGERRGSFIVRKPIRWLFAGTGLEKGDAITSGGIEADRTYAASPKNVQVVAEIPNLYPGYGSAQMTYYERGGAKVFAAGAFTLAGAIWEPHVRGLFENLWNRLANDTDTGNGADVR